MNTNHVLETAHEEFGTEAGGKVEIIYAGLRREIEVLEETFPADDYPDEDELCLLMLVKQAENRSRNQLIHMDRTLNEETDDQFQARMRRLLHGHQPWNQLVISRNPGATRLNFELSYLERKSVLNDWSPYNSIELIQLSEPKALDYHVFEATYTPRAEITPGLESYAPRRIVVKMSWNDVNEDLVHDVEIHRELSRKGINFVQKFLGFVTELGRVIGFALEHVPIREKACGNEITLYRNVIQKFHGLGYAHGRGWETDPFVPTIRNGLPDVYLRHFSRTKRRAELNLREWQRACQSDLEFAKISAEELIGNEDGDDNMGYRSSGDISYQGLSYWR
ncbi:hypothetical protein AAP_03328 [Ascosphaera apis ARSEF 7405]|uniref:Uncharacterized protein n=1 Tax=Ascosphaera apis ARSEF 7405 TaxID=392613 RepID=A0A167YQ59_9EURO|nr:hypothetical protein AAP_03328 [Ascosphaera apis ARSEF 7405]